jgi:predicted PurR-regulated permease PerM
MRPSGVGLQLRGGTVDFDKAEEGTIAEPEVKYRVTSKGLLKKSHAIMYFLLPALLVIIILIVLVAITYINGGENLVKSTENFKNHDKRIEGVNLLHSQLKNNTNNAISDLNGDFNDAAATLKTMQAQLNALETEKALLKQSV